MRTVRIHRHKIQFLPDSSRVLIRPFIPLDSKRIANILSRAFTLSEEETRQELAKVMSEFAGRHMDIEKVLLHHFAKVQRHMPTGKVLSKARQLFIGSLFIGEYALESAALFNPSIVPHPDQSGLTEGALRVVISLRATGEGHISSIEFRSGVIDAQGAITIDPVSRYVTAPELVPNPTYDKTSFVFKLVEMGFENKCMETLVETLGEKFTLAELDQSVKALRRRSQVVSRDEQRTVECVRWLAESNYELRFDPKVSLSERIIFPVSANESNGIEDARFVRFVD